MKDFEEKGMPEILQKSSKTRDGFIAILDCQNNTERALFLVENRQLKRSFQRMFIALSCLRFVNKCSS